MDSKARAGGRVEALGRLSGFRREFYGCLTRRGDALFELTDAVLRPGAGDLPAGAVALTGAPTRARGDVPRLRQVGAWGEGDPPTWSCSTPATT